MTSPSRANSTKELDSESQATSAAAPWWQTPRVIAWAVAGGCAAAFLGFALFTGSGKSDESPPPVPLDAAQASPEKPAAKDASPTNAAAPTKKVESALEVSNAAAAKKEPDATSRLARLGQALKSHLEENGTFPPGTQSVKALPPESRLSWLATLVPQFALNANVPVVWDRSWQDPLNDAFVRRRLLEFQNPAVDLLTGTDGYPATHFVGIAGVGPDARRLAFDDPRAGIFGDDRRTRLEDIKDGASHTLLVAGVQDHLGSWAAGGSPTVRGLTREPYVNGPDGFGTGQAGSMLVLMADGSVRSITATVSPEVLRHLAAMADGLPREPVSTGEPPAVTGTSPAGKEPAESPLTSLILKRQNKTPPAPPAAARNQVTAGTAQPPAGAEGAVPPPPAEPEAAPPPPKQKTAAEIEAALKQPIVSYQQSKTSSLADALRELAAMAGAPIAWEAAELGPAGARLNQPVNLKLDKTTLREILDKLLEPARLTYRIEAGRIRLVPKG